MGEGCFGATHHVHESLCLLCMLYSTWISIASIPLLLWQACVLNVHCITRPLAPLRACRPSSAMSQSPLVCSPAPFCRCHQSSCVCSSALPLLSPSTCVCSPAHPPLSPSTCVLAPPLSPSMCVCSAAETSSLDDDLEKRRAERKAAREARLRA